MLVTSFENGSKGRSVSLLPEELRAEIAKAGGESLTLRLRTRDPAAAQEALAAVKAGGDGAKLEELIEVFGEVRYPEAQPVLLDLLKGKASQSTLKNAINALQIFEEPQVADGIVAAIPKLETEVRLTAFNALASRSAWARTLLKAVSNANIETKSVPPEIVDKLRADENLASLVDEVFGPKRILDTDAINEKLQKFATTIRSGSGNPFEGYKNYNLACSSCHKLFGEGGQIGPDLTAFKRDDLDTMLMNIVNPSGEIREGFENVVIETRDGRNLSGFLAERYEDAVVLRGLDGESILIKKDNIARTKSAGGSLMPEGLLDGFEDQQIRDLFAYLRSTQPLVKQR